MIPTSIAERAEALARYALWLENLLDGSDINHAELTYEEALIMTKEEAIIRANENRPIKILAPVVILTAIAKDNNHKPWIFVSASFEICMQDFLVRLKHMPIDNYQFETRFGQYNDEQRI
jgi:hypothetical protein